MARFELASSPAPKAGGVTGLPNISLFILAVLTGFEPATFPQTTGYPTIGRQDLFAVRTGFEPVTFAVTVRYCNQLY